MNLPEELILFIVAKLAQIGTVNDLIRVAQINQQWYRIVAEPVIWQSVKCTENEMRHVKMLYGPDMTLVFNLKMEFETMRAAINWDNTFFAENIKDVRRLYMKVKNTRRQAFERPLCLEWIVNQCPSTLTHLSLHGICSSYNLVNLQTDILASVTHLTIMFADVHENDELDNLDIHASTRALSQWLPQLKMLTQMYTNARLLFTWTTFASFSFRQVKEFRCRSMCLRGLRTILSRAGRQMKKLMVQRCVSQHQNTWQTNYWTEANIEMVHDHCPDLTYLYMHTRILNPDSMVFAAFQHLTRLSNDNAHEELGAVATLPHPPPNLRSYMVKWRDIASVEPHLDLFRLASFRRLNLFVTHETAQATLTHLRQRLNPRGFGCSLHKNGKSIQVYRKHP